MVRVIRAHVESEACESPSAVFLPAEIGRFPAEAACEACLVLRTAARAASIREREIEGFVGGGATPRPGMNGALEGIGR